MERVKLLVPVALRVLLDADNGAPIALPVALVVAFCEEHRQHLAGSLFATWMGPLFGWPSELLWRDGVDIRQLHVRVTDELMRQATDLVDAVCTVTTNLTEEERWRLRNRRMQAQVNLRTWGQLDVRALTSDVQQPEVGRRPVRKDSGVEARQQNAAICDKAKVGEPVSLPKAATQRDTRYENPEFGAAKPQPPKQKKNSDSSNKKSREKNRRAA